MNGSNYLLLFFFSTQMSLYEYVGGTGTRLAYNTSATTTTGVWYDVLIRCDGTNVKVWRRQRDSDQEMALIFDNTVSVIAAGYMCLKIEANATYRIDNVRIVGDEDIATTTTFAYDTANELTAQTTNSVTTSYTYDDWGRTWSKSMQSGAHQAICKYQYGHKLANFYSTFPDEAASAAWMYDGLGKRRMWRFNGGNYSYWRWDIGYNPIAEYHDTDTNWFPNTKAISYIPGLAEQVTSTGAYRYYSTDFLGSVRRMRDDTKASLATYEYEPYGGAYYASGIALDVGFTGHQWDPNMGLYYAPFRWYNAGAARWLTRDPLGMVDGPNVYAYAKGNPVTFRDPSGMITFCGVWVAISYMYWLASHSAREGYRHCMVTCEVSKTCGKADGEMVGYYNELIDEIEKRLHLSSTGWDSSDIAANKAGLDCAGETCGNGGDCGACCEKRGYSAY